MLNRIMENLFPEGCMICNTGTSIEDGICLSCRNSIKKVPEPVCEICGYPIGTPGLCLKCTTNHPPYDRLISAYSYEGTLKEIIRSFKYKGKTSLKRYLGRVIHNILLQEKMAPDIITFIPMHYTRLFERGYNHSALIAKETAKLSGLKTDFTLLKKSSRTAAQAGLKASERRRNIENSFFSFNASGLKVLVIDDVITTGETAAAAAKALKSAGAESVYVAGVGRALSWQK